jgi:hypothetical protein
VGMMSFLGFIIISLVVLVIFGGVIIILYRIKEARLYGKNITKKNKIYALISKYLLKELPE